MDLTCGKVTFGEGEDIPVVYGKLRYSAPTEATIPEGMVEDAASQIQYNQIKEEEKTDATTFEDILILFLTIIITAIVVYTLSRICLPQYTQKITGNSQRNSKELKNIIFCYSLF